MLLGRDLMDHASTGPGRITADCPRAVPAGRRASPVLLAARVTIGSTVRPVFGKGRAVGEDFVIDMVIEVDSRGIDVDALARQITVPGVEVLRTSGRGMIWVTALVTADGEAAAINSVQDQVLPELSDGSRVVVVTAVTSAPLGDLYARLDPVLADHELDRLDLIDLVEATVWMRDDVAHVRTARSLDRTA